MRPTSSTSHSASPPKSPSMPSPAASSRATSPRSAIRPCSAPPASPPRSPPPAPKRPRTSRSSSPSTTLQRSTLRPGLSATAKITIAHKADDSHHPHSGAGHARSRMRKLLLKNTASLPPPRLQRSGQAARPRPGRLSRRQGRQRQAPRPLRARNHRHHRGHRHRSPQRPRSRTTRSLPAATRSCAPSRAAPLSKATPIPSPLSRFRTTFQITFLSTRFQRRHP